MEKKDVLAALQRLCAEIEKDGTPRYWSCIIGPITPNAVPSGSDLPMRQAVQKAFFALTGEGAKECFSGWGVTEEEKEYLLSFPQ